MREFPGIEMPGRICCVAPGACYYVGSQEPFNQTADVRCKDSDLVSKFSAVSLATADPGAAVHLGPPLSKTFSEKAQAEVDD